MYKLTKTQLLFDLYVAFEMACKHKNNKPYVIKYKENLHNNLVTLADSLWDRTYRPKKSVCFIVTHPKKREVFAANFQDRIVHHLYFNYVHKLFENTFIFDNYSCIKDRGTHFGIRRLEHHIREESNNYKDDCYVLKMDIKGYFMHIERQLVCDITLNRLNKMSTHKVSKNNKTKWNEFIDYDFITYLTKEIALLNPTTDCIFRSKREEWSDLPKSKSLFHVPDGCGLPIGNLTSQLYSNIFLNELDQYIKRDLNCKHYGRYVDDFYIVSKDKEFLKSLIPLIESFLKDKLHLDTNQGKTKIIKAKYGVEFLGAFIKPHRTYISNACIRRIKNQLFRLNKGLSTVNPINSINSFLGIFSHYKSFNIRKELFERLDIINEIGVYNDEYTKFFPKEEIKKGRLSYN